MRLENNFVAFTVTEPVRATVTVTGGGPLQYGHTLTGPFHSDGTIALGDSREFEPGELVALYAVDATDYGITFSQPQPAQPLQAPDSDDGMTP